MKTNRLTAVALIGRRCPDNMNLGLGYLHAALREAEIPATTFVLNAAQELQPLCDQIVDGDFSIVGLSLADGGAAFLPLAMGELLRKRGYRGHITCGGQFATSARKWLLERYDFIDSVVRFAGEAPLIELARRTSRGAAFDDVAGVTTRRGDGKPSDVLCELPMSVVPVREDMPQLLGHRMAHIAATRGCRGRCTYCGPAALLTQEWREGRQLGIDAAALDQAGVGGVRRRSLDQVSDEMADLWRQRGVRYFYFVDEHLLPYDEQQAVEYLRCWQAELSRRDIGPFGIGTMLRCDRITPAVTDAFVDLGLVRAFIGIEFGTESEALLFGRKTKLEDAPGILRALHQRGVATVSNMMLLHPYSTPETLRAGLQFLEDLPCGTFEITQMRVYHGTRLHERMRREGRLLGNPLRYGYTYDEPTIARFAELLQRLRAEAFHDYSVAIRSHDAALTLALARRLHPGARLSATSDRLDEAVRGTNKLYVASLRAALALAEGGARAADATELMEDAALGARLLVLELDDIADDIAQEIVRQVGAETRREDDRGDPRGALKKTFSPMRAAAASALRFVVVGATLSSPLACSHRAVAPDVAQHDASSETRPLDAARCTPAQRAAQRTAIEAQVPRCFSGSVSLDAEPPRVTRSTSSGMGLAECRNQTMQKVAADESSALQKVIVGLPRDCLAGETLVLSGNDKADRDAIRAAIEAACGPGALFNNRLAGVLIELDQNGNVLDVRAAPQEAPTNEALTCIKKAVAGLTFPCLAGYQLCTEHVIVE